MTTTIYQLPQAFDLPVSVSPYCAKLELYFRLTDRPYETAVGNIRKSPNAKVPYVKWGDGAIEADSTEIIARLEGDGPALDDGLSDAESALSTELQGEIEAKLYFACLYARFVDPKGWTYQKPILAGLLPWLLRPVLVPLIHKSITKQCAENGFADERGYPAAREVVERLSTQLGDKDFLLGDTPRVVDCMAWATLLQTTYTLSDNPGRAAVREHANLGAYIDRLAARTGLTLPALPG